MLKKILFALLPLLASNLLSAVLPDHYIFNSRIDYPIYRYPMDICVEDLNNDGHLDLVVSSEGSDSASKDSISVFINKGDGSFYDPVNYYTHEQSFSLCVGDFNADGFADVATANYFSKDLSVLFNLGNATFSSSVNYPIHYHTWDVTTADMNSDDYLDLIATSEGQYLFIFYNDGSGNFIRDSVFLNQNSIGLVPVDIDNDSDQDIVATSKTGNSLAIIYNNNNTYSVSYIPINGFIENIIAEDFNNDGFKDIAIHGMPAGYPMIFLNYGNGQLDPNYIVPINDLVIQGIQGTDVNSDGLTDLIVSKSNPYEFLQIYINEGQCNFSFLSEYYSGSSLNPKIQIADLNNDGERDILITNAYSRSISVFFNTGNSNYMTPHQVCENSNIHTITSADFDNDGDYDIAAADFYQNFVIILNNVGHDSFISSDKFPVGKFSDYIYSCDLNNDEFEDLLLLSNMKDSMTILLNSGNNSFSFFSSHYTGIEPTSVNSADFDNNGYLDPVITSGYNDEVYIFFNAGNGLFSDSVLFNAGNYPNSTTLFDIENDGDIDIILSNYYGRGISILENNGFGVFCETQVYFLGNWCTDIDHGDFDNDGYMDIAVSHIYKDGITIFRNNKNGTFYNITSSNLGICPISIKIEDFDLDGNKDIITLNTEICGGDNISFYRNESDFYFKEIFNFGTCIDPAFFTIQDFDNDGDFDVVFCGDNGVSIMKNKLSAVSIEETHPSDICQNELRFVSLNIFTEQLKFEIELNNISSIEFSILDISGRIIYTRVIKNLARGTHNITWNLTDNRGLRIGPGIYFYVVKSNMNIFSGKISIIE